MRAFFPAADMQTFSLQAVVHCWHLIFQETGMYVCEQKLATMHNFFSDLAKPINYCKGSRAIIAASMNHSGRKPIAGYKEDGVRVESHDILWVGFPEVFDWISPR